MQLIFKSLFGSKLYGTNSPLSDVDFKAIYLPSIEDLILQNVPKSINNITKKDCTVKNTKGDVDMETYSLPYFLKLAMDGETASLDMLHTPKGFEEITSPEWEFITTNRSRFYTKNLKAFLGYAKTQSARYNTKGSRLAAATVIMKWLDDKFIADENNQYVKLLEVWDNIPRGEHIEFGRILDARQEDNRYFSVCSRKFMADTRLKYVRECIQSFYDSYGQRAKLAELNEGIDWKAVSHCIRACLQLKEIYLTGDLIFPLKDAEYLKDIKLGKYHYKNDGIGERINELITEVEELANSSNYPERVDKEFWDNWLLSLYGR